MWPLVVPVVHEFSVGWVDPGFNGVGFVECLDLAYCAWSPYAGDYMLDAVSAAEPRELRDASSCGIELCSSVSEYLLRGAVFLDAFFE